MTDFAAAYRAVLAGWPDVEVTDVPGPYGPTRVLSGGPPDGRPLVLLPGAGATAASWSANAAGLARVFRVRVLDLPGDAGFTTAAVPDADGLCGWLDALLGPDPVGLAGHSYGAWVAVTYALHAPDRVRRLALLDPTNLFAGFSPRYLAHAAPTLLRPSRRRTLRLLRWETGGRALPAAWTELAGLATEQPRSGTLVTRPKPEVARLAVPTLVLLAGRSRAHDVGKVEAAARRVPGVRTEVVPSASHHSMPFDPADEIDRALLTFFT